MREREFELEHARTALAHKRKHANFSFTFYFVTAIDNQLHLEGAEDSTYICSRPLMIDEVPGDGNGE